MCHCLLISNFLLQEYAPIPRTLSLADCQNECAKIDSCQYWSYHQPQQKCFLKDHRNAKTTLDYLSKGYISGIKKCPEVSRTATQLESQIEIGGQSFTFLPSTFGKQFRSGDTVSFIGIFRSPGDFNERTLRFIYLLYVWIAYFVK